MIKGEATNLRAVERWDDVTIQRWFNDPDLMRHWGIGDATRSLGSLQDQIERWLGEESDLGRPSAFIVEDLEQQSIGLIILSDHRSLERSTALSILIDPSFQNQGHGSDAIRALLDACFFSWNLHRVWLQVEASNDRARAFYERLGFRHEGTLRDATFLDGSYHDVLVYGLLATDLTAAELASPEDE